MRLSFRRFRIFRTGVDPYNQLVYRTLGPTLGFALNLLARESVRTGRTMRMRKQVGNAARTATDAEDRRLMQEVAQGSDEAFRVLIQRYESVLLNLFARLGAQRDEADDAVQETLLRLHAYRRRYRPTGTFRTFLFTIARRAWLDLCRRRERRRRLETAGQELSEVAQPEGLSLEDHLDLEASLAELPEGHRMVLVLSIFGGLKYEEIAEVMSIPEGTVKSRVFHGLRKLRARLVRDPTT